MEIWTQNTRKKRSRLNERSYQNAAIDRWKECGGWAQSVHPGIGTKSGIPDTLFKYDRYLIPIEFKLGEVKKDTLFVEEIRVAQRRWHRGFRNSGGVSGIIVGTENGFFAISIDQFLSGELKFKLKDVEGFTDAKEAIEYIARPLSTIL